MRTSELSTRLRVFTDAGLLPRVPTPWQIRQGEIEMAAYVTSTDATAEEGYHGAPLGHPVLRQPLIFSQVGLDHLSIGSALGVAHASLCAHLELTYHRGMPVFDLQAVQTHPDGLARLHESMRQLLEGVTPRARRRRRIARLILADVDGYIASFLGPDGWIARAERLDYASAESEGSAFPPEFFSLVSFLDYCAQAFPARRADIPLIRLPGHLLGLAGRRFREGRGFGWFS